MAWAVARRRPGDDGTVWAITRLSSASELPVATTERCRRDDADERLQARRRRLLLKVKLSPAAQALAYPGPAVADAEAA